MFRKQKAMPLSVLILLAVIHITDGHMHFLKTS